MKLTDLDDLTNDTKRDLVVKIQISNSLESIAGSLGKISSTLESLSYNSIKHLKGIESTLDSIQSNMPS